MDPARSTTDPVRTKRDQGLGLGIVLVPASYSNGRIQRSDGCEVGDPTDPARKPTDPARSTTDPVRTKRDQGLELGIEQGLGLGIVPVQASDGSRGHQRAGRREEVGGERGERVADSPREENEAREERARRHCGGEPREESRERGERVRANELGRRSETRPAGRDGRFYTPYSNDRIQRSDGSEAGDPMDPARKPTDSARKPTDPARTKRDQGLGLGIEQGLGLGIVPVSASGGSRGHWRVRRREEVGGERGERVADADSPREESK